MTEGDDDDDVLYDTAYTNDPDDGDNDGVTSVSFSDITGFPSVLTTFANNPRQTIVGVIGSVIIGGILDIWNVVLKGLTLVLWGDSLATTEGQIGVIDIPVRLTELAISAASPIGDGLLAPLEAVYASAASVTSSLGLAAFPAGVAVVVGTVVLTQQALERTGWATLAAIPVIGPLMETLLR